ncbi:lytic transglycosylase domain-containing protein [Limibacillus halophilus]|uniref:Soluble lytic murein transglycosylase-like protein n=1 Tax=Limibacillus halophilus TaxID=1579333 RepID=A0A839SVG4_9PROT|nr:lytic transglycosylase domain-containing protein [Limibacillus halophilus]MBB3066019.1 soluble lytic murein transglycosylase-like protein [Limibacillus halophilus]
MAAFICLLVVSLVLSGEPAIAADKVEATGVQSLPRPLSQADAERYQKILALQRRGQWDAADGIISELEDPLLLGHVLFQRYMHPTAYRSRYGELAAWLRDYRDHPGADRIYKLALQRQPASAPALVEPRASGVLLPPFSLALDRTPAYVSPRARSSSERQQATEILTQVRRNVMRDRLSATEAWLASAEVRQVLDQVELDVAYGEVAAGWYYLGRDNRALALAAPAAKRSGAMAPYATWIAGLASWRLERFEDAGAFFGKLAGKGRASPASRAAGAYWAARVALRLKQPQAMSHWLRLAAAEGHSFYGLLARDALGIAAVPSIPPSNLAALGGLEANPAIKRSMALLQIDRRDLAEAELLQSGGWEEEVGARQLLILADAAGLPHLSYRLAGQLLRLGVAPDDPHVITGLYPLPHWKPESGFLLDRALIFAFVRQESRFDPRAQSSSGARGLMQILPSTASYISGDSRYSNGRLRNLYIPEVNLDLGQSYLSYLLDQSMVEGDLFRLAAAYNGGPGNLLKWQRETDHRYDPLLFIESLPSRQTRFFIERVLANFWMYRARLGQESPSLKTLAAGDWPHYLSLDDPLQEAARRGTE